MKTSDMPETGGRWSRDPKTGALSPLMDEPDPDPAVDEPNETGPAVEKRKGKS